MRLITNRVEHPRHSHGPLNVSSLEELVPVIVTVSRSVHGMLTFLEVVLRLGWELHTELFLRADGRKHTHVPALFIFSTSSVEFVLVFAESKHFR